MRAQPAAPVDDAGESSTPASRRLCVACGTMVTTLSLVVLAGWALGILPLERVAPGLPAMTPDTAVGLSCAGLGLVCLARGPRVRGVGRCLGGLAAVIGLLVIFEYLVAPVGIDQLLFHDPGAVDPGRPSPHTAVALIALGGAFVTSGAPRVPRWAHQSFLGLSAAVAVSALVGYIYDVDFLRGVSGSDGMAVHTLAAVILLTIGAIALHPGRGLLGLMRGDGGGAIVARTLVPLAFAPLAIGSSLFAMQDHGVIGVRLALSLFTLAMVGFVAVVGLLVATRARRADARAREVSTRLQALVDHVPAALSLRGLDGRYLTVNDETAAIVGRPVSELLGRPPDGPEVAASILADDLEMRRSRRPISHELRLRHADGSLRDYQVIRYPVLDPDGEVVAFGNFAFDLTEQKRTIAALELAQQRFRSMFEEAPIGMAVLTREGRFEQVNDALCQILGYPREQLEGTDSGSLMSREDLQASRAVRETLLEGGTESGTLEARYRHAAGHTVVVDVHLGLVRGPDGEPLHILAQVQDITERKRDHAHLEHLADHDSLTGIKNRRGFQRTLERYASHERRRGPGSALMVVDLDQFKRINDTLGHQAGDELIVYTARVLERQLRATDVVARLGGDEFAVLLPETVTADAVRVGEHLLSTLRADAPPITGLTHSVTASVGVASLGDLEGVSAREVLRRADQAMYEAKTSGRDRICVWSPTTPSAAAVPAIPLLPTRASVG